MNKPTYTVDEIHKMRIEVAELYRKMNPIEAERDFKTHVDNAKQTMEKLRKERYFITDDVAPPQ